MSFVGNCDICVKQKILVTNTMIQMKFILNWKFRAEKNFIEHRDLLLSSGWSLPNFHPFFMAWMNANKIQSILDDFLKSIEQHLP